MDEEQYKSEHVVSTFSERDISPSDQDAIRKLLSSLLGAYRSLDASAVANCYAAVSENNLKTDIRNEQIRDALTTGFHDYMLQVDHADISDVHFGIGKSGRLSARVQLLLEVTGRAPAFSGRSESIHEIEFIRSGNDLKIISDHEIKKLN